MAPDRRGGAWGCTAGFSLVEVIAVLLLVGIVSAMAGLGLVNMAEGFATAAGNAEGTRKAQLAMARLDREFSMITAVENSGPRSITFTSRHGVAVERHTVAWSGRAGEPLMLDRDILTDRVGDFSLSYVYFLSGGATGTDATWSARSRAIDLSLVLDVGHRVAQGTRVFPRNLGSGG